MTTCQQRPQILGPEGGRCTQVWLYYDNLFFIEIQFEIERHI